MPGKYGPDGSFSSWFRRSRRLYRSVRPSASSSMLTSALPFASADVLKKCALLAVHLIAEEGRDGDDGCHVPGRMENGLPKEPNVGE